MTRAPQTGNQWARLSRNDFGTWFPSDKDTFYQEWPKQITSTSVCGRAAWPLSEEEAKPQMVFRLWRTHKLLLVEDFSLIPTGYSQSSVLKIVVCHIVVPHFILGSSQTKKKILNVAFSQADVCNKSSRSGELYSIWHVRLLLQVGIKTKKTPTYTRTTWHKLNTSTVSERETGAGKMMKRVPRRGSGTFSQPVAKRLSSFCLHFGQTSSRLQSQWDLSAQMRHLLYVACKNSKSVVEGEEGRVALKDPSVQQVMSAERKCTDSSGNLPSPFRNLKRWECMHFKPSQKHFCLILWYVSYRRTTCERAQFPPRPCVLLQMWVY